MKKLIGTICRIIFWLGAIIIIGHFILVEGLIFENWFLVIVGLCTFPITYFVWPLYSGAVVYTIWPILLISVIGYTLSNYLDKEPID